MNSLRLAKRSIDLRVAVYIPPINNSIYLQLYSIFSLMYFIEYTYIVAYILYCLILKTNYKNISFLTQTDPFKRNLQMPFANQHICQATHK